MAMMVVLFLIHGTLLEIYCRHRFRHLTIFKGQTYVSAVFKGAFVECKGNSKTSKELRRRMDKISGLNGAIAIGYCLVLWFRWGS